MSLRGSHGRRDPPARGARLPGAEPDEGIYALRHGPVPGALVRHDGRRADRRRAAARRRRRRPLPDSRADQARHRRRDGRRARTVERFSARRISELTCTPTLPHTNGALP
ncbi:hypothetical protein BCEN4_1590010 [Burkholderia cenocepacia]|nr:hypothetical protein BCEN4_1590010 [Burkholderia cenocepacia]